MTSAAATARPRLARRQQKKRSATPIANVAARATPSEHADLHEEAERGIAVLVERVAELEQRAEVVVQSREREDEEKRGRRRPRRRRASPGPCPIAASQTPSGQRKNFTAPARPIGEPRREARRRGSARRARRAGRGTVSGATTRISPITGGHSANAPYTRQSRTPTMRSESSAARARGSRSPSRPRRARGTTTARRETQRAAAR